ncbi:MAG: (deoxy)nucleoside triphosphate pyrophosphohydrolase [Flavobacteriales bacterium]|nr:(deoxy)nucleoside triphosphate pyrophosphohydrolase [Flavobacteriales bacterium]
MIEVVAAVIELNGKLLAFQRGQSKYQYISNKFEFPGGKVEHEEDHKLALSRELKEELAIEADIHEHIVTIDYTYPDFSIRMYCFLVKLGNFDGQLNEHISYAHVGLSDADTLDWVEADRPVLQLLKDQMSHVFKD